MTLTLTAPQGSEVFVRQDDNAHTPKTGFWALTIGSIGVVLNDHRRVAVSRLPNLRESCEKRGSSRYINRIT